MPQRLFERILDRLAPRLSAVGATRRQFSPAEFDQLIGHLLSLEGLRLNSRVESKVVLVASGAVIGSLGRRTPRLRYQLQRREDGRINLEVFEHVLCTRKQAGVFRELCTERTIELLTLIDSFPGP